MQRLNEIWQFLVKSCGVAGPPILQKPKLHISASDKRSTPSKFSERRRESGCVRSMNTKYRSLSAGPVCHADSQTERSMSMIKSKVLVVDDEESIRRLIKEVLTREGRQVLLSSGGNDAVQMFQQERPDITILDIGMPGLNGIEVLRRIRAMDQSATVMVFSGSCTAALVKQAQDLGVTEFLEKGPSLSTIWEARTRRM